MLWMGKTILYHGFSLEAALKVRQALTEAGIDYAYRVINNTFGSSRMLSMGEFTMEYEIRVQQRDLEQARQVISALSLPF